MVGEKITSVRDAPRIIPNTAHSFLRISVSAIRSFKEKTYEEQIHNETNNQTKNIYTIGLVLS